MLKKMKLTTKIFATIGPIILIFSLLFLVFIYYQTKTNYMNNKKQEIASITNIPLNILEYYNQKISNGTYTQDEAKTLAFEEILTLRYGSDLSDYFFILNLDNIMLVHPTSSLINKNMDDFKDVKGILFFKEMAKIANSSGAGYVPYFWADKIDKNKNVPKLSYIKVFAPWNIYIGTGIYVDQAQTDARKEAIKLFSLIGFFMIVLMIIIILFLRKVIVLPINKVSSILKDTSNEVSSAADQIAQSSQAMASGASEQASNIEEISSTLEQMSSITKQNADNANQANTMSSTTLVDTEQSQKAMAKMLDAIGKIKESSDETVKIIKTINEIAFQTNILAINAAIEAAKAGENGKGFAVVAIEVRNLAQRSAEAVKTTSTLLEGSKSNAENGVFVANEVNEILNNVIISIKKVSDLISEVSTASSEQAKGIEQVNIAISQSDQVTQSNAATAEESASSSEELSSQAKRLDDMVTHLIAIINGQKETQNNK